MDDPNRPRRQNEPPMHPSSDPRYPQGSLQGRRSIPAGSTDRFNRPAPLNTPPSQGRAVGSVGGYGAYNYPDQVAGSFSNPMAATSTMPYQSGYGQDGRQQQSFAGYNAMPLGYDSLAAPAGPVYDTQSHFQRQPAAPSILPSDVSAAYFSNDPANAQGGSNLSHAQSTSSSASAYHGSSQIANYPSTHMSGVGGISETAPAPADVSMEEQDYAAAPSGLEEKWIEYQAALRDVFQNIRGLSLENASTSLQELSNWLLTQVTDLGLNLDDSKLHGDRIKLWEDFNHAWLGLLQAQKDASLSGRQIQRGQSLMTCDNLDKLGHELVRLCDGIERHGLVDYQYGVWEKQITNILIECMDILESPGGGGGGGSIANPSGSGSRGTAD